MFVEIFLFVIVIYLLKKWNQKPDDIPPGQWGLPLIGALPPRNIPMKQHLKNQRSKHGDIFCTRIGQRTFVYLCDFKIIKEALSKKEFSGRPDFFSFRLFKFRQNLGIAFAEGEVWESNRRFILRHLKDFGFGTSRMEELIDLEVSSFIKELHGRLNEPLDLDESLNVCILNVLWRLIADQHYNRNDPKIKRFLEDMVSDVEDISGPVSLLDTMPSLAHAVPKAIQDSWMKVKKIEDHIKNLATNFLEDIAQHLKTLVRERPRDIIDYFLIENKTSTFSISEALKNTNLLNTVAILTDLFGAGTDTTSSTLRWFFLHMAVYKDIQTSIQKEMDKQIPEGDRIGLQHRDKLPYLDATILEVLRTTSFLPQSLPHSTIKATTLKGYRIPKGSVVVPCLEMCHKDSKYWEKPDEFYPHHFLSKDGKVNRSKPGFLPFSIGRRQCLGESMAKMELFLFTGRILQNFSIDLPEGETHPSLIPSTSSHLFNYPQPFKIVVSKRKLGN